MGRQAEDVDGDDGQDQADQRPGEPVVDALGGDDHGQDAERRCPLTSRWCGSAGRRRGGAGRWWWCPRRCTPRMTGSWRTTISTAIPARTPVITGVDRNSEIQPRRSRPTAISSAPTSSAVKAMARAVAERPHRRDGRHAGGQHRRDGGVRPDREVAVRAEQGVEQRSGDEGVEPGHRRQVRQPRGGHLRRQRHGDQRQAGQRIGAQPRCAVAPQRGRHQPGCHASSWRMATAEHRATTREEAQ